LKHDKSISKPPALEIRILGGQLKRTNERTNEQP